ncbi:unnamed protein product [Phaedon cochleariae]|uniref:PH domain-containing protein n=1 Tax=Phaedon cochleariae TaxID=80249 RepID=A0A9P0DQC4_PHACE|nr:unnamed protein product [Phaedon cochleariae]
MKFSTAMLRWGYMVCSHSARSSFMAYRYSSLDRKGLKGRASNRTELIVRIVWEARNKPYHIPSGLIELVEIKELFNLYIGCKDARTYRCTFENNEKCQVWYERILKAAEPPRQVEQLFAFYHYIWSKEKGSDDVIGQIENQLSDNGRQIVYDRGGEQSQRRRLRMSRVLSELRDPVHESGEHTFHTEKFPRLEAAV